MAGHASRPRFPDRNLGARLGPRVLAIVAAALVVVVACAEREVERRREAPVPEGAEVMEWAPETTEASPPSALSETPPPALADPPPPPIERAPAPDTSFAGSGTVAARRVVYRVRIGIPGILGVPIVDLAVPAAELYVDVSVDRLRARFVGSGWPLDEGAEVRLRGDSPGAYVFDGAGGRSMEPGALAHWFEGGEPRPGPRAYVRRDTSVDDEGTPLPGPLVCALVAEWSGVPRSSLAARCGNAAPVAFRAGAYRAERTADVPLSLPRSALAADETGPPDPVSRSSSAPFLEADALGRLRADFRRGDDRTIERTGEGGPGGGLVLENHSEGRVVVVVDGVAAGYVDSLSEIEIVGLSHAVHEVGAMRPLGAVVMRPRLVEVPGRTILRARPVPRDDD